jgi:hypothetical protein
VHDNRGAPVLKDPLSAYCFTLGHIDNQGLINTANERYKIANVQFHIKVLVMQMIHSGTFTSILLLLLLLVVVVVVVVVLWSLYYYY